LQPFENGSWGATTEGVSTEQTHRASVELLELMELAPVHHARDHLPHVERLARVGGDDARELLDVVGGGLEGHRLAAAQTGPLRWRPGGAADAGAVEVADDGARDAEGVAVVLRQVVSDAGRAAVHFGAPQVLSGHHLARGRLDQGRAAQEDGALPAHDHLERGEGVLAGASSTHFSRDERLLAGSLHNRRELGDFLTDSSLMAGT
jgi:hypothetical protein